MPCRRRWSVARPDLMSILASGSLQAQDIAPPSIARSMLPEDAALSGGQAQVEMVKEVTGAAYIAGTDTTVAAVMAFCLAMQIYPEVRAKGQAEVDRVVGDRLPELEDRKHMPYVEGVVSECLRWPPVLPVGEQISQYHLFIHP